MLDIITEMCRLRSTVYMHRSVCVLPFSFSIILSPLYHQHCTATVPPSFVAVWQAAIAHVTDSGRWSSLYRPVN